MTSKDKRTQWKGDVFEYQALIESPVNVREDLYCLTWAQSQALIAAIELYRYVTRWEGGSPVPDQVENFVNDTQRRLMMPCGSDNVIVMSQFDEHGHYQTSNDGGETWQDAPQQDPRRNVPLPPPFLPDGTEEAECTYADSIVNQAINAWINATGEGEDLATVIEGILSFLAGIFGAFGAVLAPILLAIAASVVAFGVEAWKAAFVADEWDKLRCNLHDNQSADGSFTGMQVDAIYERLSEDHTGIVLLTFQRLIAALGAEGLTIAARSGFGSPTAECDCDDTVQIYYQNGGAGEYEPIFPDEDGFYHITCDQYYVNGYYATLTTMEEIASPYEPCVYFQIDSVDGGHLGQLWDCHTGTPNALSTCSCLLQWYATGPYNMTFHVTPCT